MSVDTVRKAGENMSDRQIHKKILYQLGIIIFLCLTSEAIVSFLPFSFPGSVAAILIFTALLGMKVIREEQIQETADFMLANMALVFVPLNVGAIEELEILKGRVAVFFFVVIVSLLLTFTGTYATVRMVQIFSDRRRRRKDG